MPSSLCFPSARVSCAACCGLYNVSDASRPTLSARLAGRSARFRATPRTIAALCAFEEQTRQLEQLTPREPLIHVCEFCGFLDEAQRQVGCLLHPLAPGNAGQDWRGLCHYGALACTSFFCPAFSSLSAAERALLAALIDDWYLWGLAATDLDFVRLSLQLARRALGQPLTSELLSERPAACQALRQLLACKDSWPATAGQTQRTSRYHCHPTLTIEALAELSQEQLEEQLLGCLAASYERPSAAREIFPSLSGNTRHSTK